MIDAKDKKNVLICYHSSSYGGVEKHILDIIEGLSKSFNIYIVCPFGELLDLYLKAGAIKHFNLVPASEIDFKYIWQIFKICRKYKIDIIHSHELKTGVLATVGGFLANVNKRIYHVHTPFIFWKYGSIKKYPALFVNTIVNFVVANFCATDVIALTRYIKEVRIKKEHVFENKIRIIPNGIDLNKVNIDKNKRFFIRRDINLRTGDLLIGYLARFTEEKGHIDLVRALYFLIKYKKIDNIKLMLIGKGKLLENIKSVSKNLGLEKHIVYFNNVGDKDKFNVLSSLDLFVAPTHAEGFGIAIIEAMATKLPVVCSNIEVLKDVGGDSVIYFSVGDPKDLAAKVYKLYKDDSLRKEYSLRSGTKVLDYSIEKFWQNYEKLYLA